MSDLLKRLEIIWASADDTSWDAYFAATKKELEEKLAEMKSAVAG